MQSLGQPLKNNPNIYISVKMNLNETSENLINIEDRKREIEEQ